MFEEMWNEDVKGLNDDTFSYRDKKLIKIGYLLATISSLGKLVDAVPRASAPKELVDFIRAMKDDIHPIKMAQLLASL